MPPPAGPLWPELAQASPLGCLGQLLITDSGDFAAVSSLLEIVECRKRESGVWAELRAVARVRISDVSQTDNDFVSGHVRLHTDARAETLSPALVDEVRETYESCHTLSRKLREKTAVKLHKVCQRCAVCCQYRAEPLAELLLLAS